MRASSEAVNESAPARPAAPSLGAPIAYLTSQYGRASDTFIRGEVEQLRRLGYVVHTFSIRPPPKTEITSDIVRRERAATEDLVTAGAFRLLWSTLVIALTRPVRFLNALALSLRIGSPGIKARLLPLIYLMEACLLARRLRAKGIRHLHNHIGRNSAAVAMLASVISGVPYSMTVHGPTEFDMPGTLALHEKVSRSAFTIAVGHFGKSQLMRWSPQSAWSKIHVVRCGLNEEFLSIEPDPVPDNRRVVMIGRIVEQKGHLVLIEAVRKLIAEGIEIEVQIIGQGPLRGVVEAAIAKHRLGDSIKLLGWKTSPEIRQLILESRGMVLPSFAEGLPVALMEAMALGRPVISTHVASIPELIEPGVNGWLVPPGAIDELAAALKQMLTTPVQKLTQLGRAGRTRVLQQHDAAREAAKIARLIEGHQ